ncbi:nicotinate (nicotinamide) nucleotide adenylyltransferase [Candidatus Avelusimicrobium stercoris]|mgnify:FL=1|uniref:nicotinate (nicotinamide) nucleotide adenylyltransferase n=1 Tax=Candidatus Avelusimicrobium stercoris TaxID=1947924 RepID=UPI003D0DB89A
MKVLVFGGSFDPVHKGHVSLFRRAMKVIAPDVAHIVPAYHSPFKAKSPTPFRLRMKMLKQAFAGFGKNIVFDDYELKQGGKTYTYQLVQYLKKRYDNPEIYLLVGTDCLNDLHNWKNPDYIFENAVVVAGKRKGYNENPAQFRHLFLPGFFPKLSSSRVRAHILACGDVPDTVPEVIAPTIRENHLYGLDVHTWLKAHLKPNRYLHSKNVAEMAAAFSDIYDVNVELAVKAGIMHDAGKGFSGPELIAFCKEHKIKVPFFEDICRMEPSLLHSYVSAWLAQHEFGVTNKDVIRAIAEHTLGSLHMSTLSKILFVADISSKDRKYKDAFVIRNLALQDLNKALLYAANRKLLFTIDSQKWLCPLGTNLWNHLIKQEK